MDMREFKAKKAELILKWGDKLLTPTSEELKQQTEDVKALCKFAKVRPEKMLNGMAQAWMRKEW
jgi:hypothetical protein